MARKYSAEDFQALPKPVIVRAEQLHGLVMYTWLCKCSAGSRGFGTSPAHAYAKWLRNWKRRQRWYTKGYR